MTGRRKVSIKYEKLDALLERGRPENPKLHNIEGLDASLERFGYVAPVLVTA